MNALTDEDYAWAAGYIATINFRYNEESNAITLVVQRKDKDNALKLKMLFGGSVNEFLPGSYRYLVGGNNLRKAVKKMWPYLMDHQREQWERLTERQRETHDYWQEQNG